MQMIEVNISQIKYTSGIELRSKVRDGERVYILDGHTVQKIFNQHIEQITMLRSMLADKNKSMKVKNESDKSTIQTGNKYGGGYGD